MGSPEHPEPALTTGGQGRVSPPPGIAISLVIGDASHIAFTLNLIATRVEWLLHCFQSHSNDFIAFTCINTDYPQRACCLK